MKRYRYYNSRKFLNDNFYPLVEIRSRFAIFPTLINDQWVWLKSYYSLYEWSCFNFGGIDNVSYHCTEKSVTLFGFKSFLKQEGIIKNLVAEKRDAQAALDASPEWWQKIIKESK